MPYPEHPQGESNSYYLIESQASWPLNDGGMKPAYLHLPVTSRSLREWVSGWVPKEGYSEICGLCFILKFRTFSEFEDVQLKVSLMFSPSFILPNESILKKLSLLSTSLAGALSLSSGREFQGSENERHNRHPLRATLEFELQTRLERAIQLWKSCVLPTTLLKRDSFSRPLDLAYLCLH